MLSDSAEASCCPINSLLKLIDHTEIDVYTDSVTENSLLGNMGGTGFFITAVFDPADPNKHHSLQLIIFNRSESGSESGSEKDLNRLKLDLVNILTTKLQIKPFCFYHGSGGKLVFEWSNMPENRLDDLLARHDLQGVSLYV